MKYLLALILSVSPAFAEESQMALKKCFLKDYPAGKSVKRVTLALYEDLVGDTFGTLEIHLNNPKGPTSGVLTSQCKGEAGKYTCTDVKDGGKLTFVDEGETGFLKVDEPINLQTKNQYFPGQVSVTRLPASSGMKLTSSIPHACEKLVP
jgi:hypothetical protein